MSSLADRYSRATLEAWTMDARSRTLDLVRDLSDEEFLRAPVLRTINPFLWEIGHVAYFQEYWVLRHAAGKPPMLAEADSWYDSAKVAHDTRWGLPLPSRGGTIEYMEAVRDRVLDRIAGSNLSERDIYFILLSIFHEDMHDEAFTITRQTLGYRAPVFSAAPNEHHAYCATGPLSGDVTIPGGTYMIGSRHEDGFIFDNEKWAHEVKLLTFQIARAPVTQSEFLEFVQDDGYARRELWSAESWAWREREQIRHPAYWKQDPEQGWIRGHFDQWIPLEPHRPVANISWFEADAYCRWAGRRLPSEFEWQAAAAGIPAAGSANLDWAARGCCDVAGHADGDSGIGCRQMIGNVWEWTASDFLPYPGFSEDPYKEYSSPWFGTHKTLRGGAWSTRSRLIRAAYRNFYTPDRRDIWAGFRTCVIPS
ncbi:MAG: ergothioneine biosynthesis protein EgtB [Acidobacteria bacterium]|nr:MAG: ergothioneine biosynthesis protein EgtB [Acidobacteriota bacterium]